LGDSDLSNQCETLWMRPVSKLIFAALGKAALKRTYSKRWRAIRKRMAVAKRLECARL
jgi:hypothetical protein